MVELAEVPGEPAVLDHLVTSSRRLPGAHFSFAVLIGVDGAPLAMAHQGLMATQVQTMPLVPYPAGLTGLVLAGQVTGWGRGG